MDYIANIYMEWFREKSIKKAEISQSYGYDM